MRVNASSYTAWHCKTAGRARHRLWTGRHVWRISIRDGRLLYAFLRLTEWGTEEGLWGHWWFCKGSRGANQEKWRSNQTECCSVDVVFRRQAFGRSWGKPWKRWIHGNKDAPQPSGGRSPGAQGCLRGWGIMVTVPGSPTSTLTDKLLHIIFSILVTDVDVKKKFNWLK